MASDRKDRDNDRATHTLPFGKLASIAGGAERMAERAATPFDARKLVPGIVVWTEKTPLLVLQRLGAGGYATAFLVTPIDLVNSCGIDVGEPAFPSFGRAPAGTITVFCAPEHPILTTLEEQGPLRVLKLMNAASSDPSYDVRVERWRVEARCYHILERADILPRLHDFGWWPKPHLLLSFSRGPTVDETLENARRFGEFLPILRVLRLLRSLASATDELHRRGIVHRDLKPSNLIIEDRGNGEERVRLLDLGAAKFLGYPGLDETVLEGVSTGRSNLTAVLGGAPGSPDWAAPEQYDAEQQPTPAIDIFQFAEIAYALLFGNAPFGNLPMVPRFEAIQRGRLRCGRPDLSPAAAESLKRALLRSLAFSPSDRPPSTHAAADNIEAALTREQAQPRLRAVPPPTANGSRSRGRKENGGAQIRQLHVVPREQRAPTNEGLKWMTWKWLVTAAIAAAIAILAASGKLGQVIQWIMDY